MTKMTTKEYVKSEVQSPKVKTKRTWADTKITCINHHVCKLYFSYSEPIMGISGF